MSTKLYTKSGDNGTTLVTPKKRVAKDDMQIEVYGTLDELSSTIGVVLALNTTIPENIRRILLRIQQDLTNLTSELYHPTSVSITEQNIKQIENDIDYLNKDLPPLKSFILPNGNLATASCHLARTICRRAERRMVSLAKSKKISNHILQYINRLSDLLFVIARVSEL